MGSVADSASPGSVYNRGMYDPNGPTVLLEPDLAASISSMAHANGTSLDEETDRILRTALAIPVGAEPLRRKANMQTFALNLRPEFDPNDLRRLADLEGEH